MSKSKEERRARMRERVSALVAPVLEPGEQVATIVPAQSRPRGTYGLELLVGRSMLAVIRWYIVALTDRRLFLLDCGRSAALSDFWKPRAIVWAEPLTAVRLRRYKPGLLYTRLQLERLSDSADICLRAGRYTRPETSKIAGALGPAPTA